MSKGRPAVAAEPRVEGWRVRVAFHGALLHLLSATEPVVRYGGGVVQSVQLELIEGTEYGDTVGFIRWSDATAITWRKA
jgi:hypothetical protein